MALRIHCRAHQGAENSQMPGHIDECIGDFVDREEELTGVEDEGDQRTQGEGVVHYVFSSIPENQPSCQTSHGENKRHING